MPASSMSSSARAERVAERAKSKQRQAGQEPPKKKPKNKASHPADQGAQQPRTQDAFLSSSGPSDTLLTLPSCQTIRCLQPQARPEVRIWLDNFFEMRSTFFV